MDRGIGDVEHQPCDIAKERALFGGHACREERPQHEVIECDDRIGQALLLNGTIVAEPFQPDGEKVEADGKGWFSELWARRRSFQTAIEQLSRSLMKKQKLYSLSALVND